MIIRKLENNKIKLIELGYNQEQEQDFIKLNESSGFMLVDSLPYSEAYPEYSNWKWQNGQIVVDDAENEKQFVADKIKEYKKFLADTDYKMTSDYDKDVTEITALRAEAREYIRSHED